MADEKKEMETILQSCLEAMQNGPESLDPIIAGYPEEGPELLPLLEAALWLCSFRGAIEPRPGFIGYSRTRLISLIQ